MIRGGDSGTLAACRSSSSTTATRRRECAAAFAAWTGFRSPLRHQLGSVHCLAGGHALWWRVQADDAAAALALLPRFVARRTVPIEIRDVEIP